MRLIPADDPEVVEVAAAALRAGLVVLLPTDTIYGLACLPTVPGSTEAVFRLKGRPRDVPLPVLVADPEQAIDLAAEITRSAARLMEDFWPGPLTLVLTRRPGLDLDVGGDPATIGVRCPDHPLVRSLARAVGPVAVTSANAHDAPTPAFAAEAVDALREPAGIVVIDGGPCSGVASTVVDARGTVAHVLREGALSERAIQVSARR